MGTGGRFLAFSSDVDPCVGASDPGRYGRGGRGPRWGALQCLLHTMAAPPALKHLPERIEIVDGAKALGFKRALIARPDKQGPRPVLVFITGVVDEHGLENPRIVHAADTFRRGGHIVFVPEVSMYVRSGKPQR